MDKRQETWTVLKVLNWTKGYLAEKGVDNARLESEWLLCSALGLDRVGLYVNFDRPLTRSELASFRERVARRARREPLQYILGSQEFMGLEFEVTPEVLIPRHDTEVLVREAVGHSPRAGTILDVGVGSGCVAVALARAIPGSRVFGVDRSPGALKVAERNARANGADLELRLGSLFEPFDAMTFDLIVSNPPYIRSADMETLQPEVREFEPRGALDGGPDGLDFYRRIIRQAPAHLNRDAWLIFEVGIDQAGEVTGLFRAEGGFSDLFAARDVAGIERVVGGRFMGETR